MHKNLSQTYIKPKIIYQNQDSLILVKTSKSPENPMPAQILLEEYHLSLRVNATMPNFERDTIREFLNKPTFHHALRDAILAVQSQFPELNNVQFTWSM